MTPHEIAQALGLEPLPSEGGLYRQTHADAASTAIYYMMIAPDFSGLHRLEVTEVWHHYDGAPAQLLMLHPQGGVERPVLGPDLQQGQQPQIVVPAGAWQAAEPLGEWTLAGCTTAPPFTWEGFTLGEAGELAATWPAAAGPIGRLARRSRFLQRRTGHQGLPTQQPKEGHHHG